MKGHKIKIICNPYKNEISYLHWDKDRWVSLAPASELMRDKKYQETNLQHNGYDIVHKIERTYNRGTAGLEIVFEGTGEDYDEVKSLVGQFPEAASLSCSRSDTYLRSATETMPKITDVFERRKELLASCADGGEITRVLDKFSDVTKTTIPICVTGTYSAGKSAFINALIGAEALPSGTDPTTSRIYKIRRSDSGAKVIFGYNSRTVAIEYEENQFKISDCPDAELGIALEQAIGNAKEFNLADSVYCSLRELNSYANQHSSISPLVEVNIPFGHSLLNCKDYDFVIYDTPGSNSANHREHLQVLKEYLNNQTNGLPVVVTYPEGMDADDTEKLITMLDSISGNLDMSNAMVVVNKAECMTPENVAGDQSIRTKATTVMKTWKSNRLFYVSSIIGLGSKKNDPRQKGNWRDSNYRREFQQKYGQFLPGDIDDYTQLYRYNEIPQNKRDSYQASVANISEDRDMLYINSGIHCVETQIIEYAKKIALYNKCKHAQEYLREAIHVARNRISEQETLKQQAVSEVQSHLSEKEQELVRQLEEYTGAAVKKALAKHPDALIPTMKTIEERLHNIPVEEFWKIAKQKHKKDDRSRVNIFMGFCNSTVVNEKHFSFQQCLSVSRSFFEGEKRKIQDGCCKIVMNTLFLSDDEKNFLKAYIMNLDMQMPDVSTSLSSSKIQKHFLGIAIDKVNLKKAKEQMIRVLEDAARTQLQALKENHVKIFRDWVKKLRDGLSSELGLLNPELKIMSRKIKQGQNEIESLENKIVSLTEDLNSIEQLFEFQIR